MIQVRRFEVTTARPVAIKHTVHRDHPNHSLNHPSDHDKYRSPCMADAPTTVTAAPTIVLQVGQRPGIGSHVPLQPTNALIIAPTIDDHDMVFEYKYSVAMAAS